MMLRTEFPIVGLGASGGGIQALEAFFRGMPLNPGMAFVVVSHLSSGHEQHLLDAIARHTSLAVMIGVDNQQLEPNCVYLLPRDALMSIGQRRLRVIKRPANLSVRRPVDLFFSA
ncbi:chemotaxis protein CheB, partial [Achromobacter spanius]|uniref:chemotaxis protein CheB n=1 Tax=Achromobacter spanius TaxID=217203 RepID=UPI003F68D188